MTKAITKYIPWLAGEETGIEKSNVVDGEWHYVSDPPKQPAKPVDDWTYNEINDHIKYSGSHSVKKDATDMYYDREWHGHSSSGLSTPLIWTGVIFMFAAAPIIGVVYLRIGTAVIVFLVGAVIAYIGDGCR